MYTVIFSCGHVGKECFNSIKNDRENILFCDSDAEKWYTTYQGVQIYPPKKIAELKDECDVIIASGYWQEIYCQCVKEGIMADTFWDETEFYTYKEMCKKKFTFFQNYKYVEWNYKWEQKCDKLVQNYKGGAELDKCIRRVNIALSNLCNYANIHSKCPASCVKEKEILDSRTVNKIIDNLASMEFEGVIAFHTYNEPLMDPRLFYFIQTIRQKLDKADILIYSNGYYLNQTMVDELKNIGVAAIVVTGYGEKEYNRLIDLEVPLPYHVLFGHLDERLDNYNLDRPEIRTPKPCRSILSEVCIYSSGDLGVCCLDYQHPFGLGNVKEKELRDILKEEKVNTIVRNLLENERTLPICKHCGWAR